jgi:hypothetical protein
MARRCEVCESLSTFAGIPVPPEKPRRLLLGDRIVALCALHGPELRRRGASTLDELRAQFQEPEGERSLVERRTPIDRRVFPPRSEGRRGSGGRRASDRKSA